MLDFDSHVLEYLDDARVNFEAYAFVQSKHPFLFYQLVDGLLHPILKAFKVQGKDKCLDNDGYKTVSVLFAGLIDSSQYPINPFECFLPSPSTLTENEYLPDFDVPQPSTSTLLFELLNYLPVGILD